MNELQRLHDELDVADAAAPKFDVAIQLFRCLLYTSDAADE